MFNKNETVSKEEIILGVDPGTTVLGYGIILVKNNKMEMLNFGIIQLNKLSNQPEKLKRIVDRIDGLIEEYKPDALAIEAPFFGKNVQSMLKLGRAQGCVIGCALRKNIPYEEYTPKRIKQAITGSGNGSKEQVAAMLQTLLNFKEIPKYLDATDGLAAAVCHHLSKGIGENNKTKGGGWASFLSKNPERNVSK